MSDKKPVLVILTPGFPADEDDSTCLPERQVFMRALKANNPSLGIIVLSFQYPYFKKKYNWNGIEVISFNGRNNGKLSRLSVWWKVWETLRQIKKKHNILGLLSFWMGECSFIGSQFSKKYNLKFYAWILGQDARKGNKYFRFVKPKPGHLIALSDFLSQEFERNYGIASQHVIPVGIDTSMFKSGVQTRDVDIMGAGSLITLKRYDLFIQVIKELTYHFPQMHSMISGKGVQQKELEKLIQVLDVAKNITLTGELSHSAVLHLMQRAKIFLHTSSYEGFGSVCAEALYAGCHVISFCKPMINDIQHWHIVNTKEEMVQKVFEILIDPATEYHPVLFYPTEYSACAVMDLFNKQVPA